ncbi:BTB/POZ and MATH domain-containing protein 3-like [Triticum dicoccoides]|uniref:BTB/POZ and MATH domain-containing protein 3-like n=1 Tax=Triticum dicoccoides TaxID=85692 RepID=UPI00188EF560|nr:BTB/POZ and MATH domain-containing protein 3-like [Triticum dicoccoides]
MSTSVILSAMRGAGRQQITASTVRAKLQASGSHVLRIEEFTRAREKLANGIAIMSSPFGAGGHDWFIQCYLNGVPGGAGNHISLFLQHDSHAKTGDATATYRMSILDKALKSSCTKFEQERHFRGDGWGWTEFIGLQDLDRDKHLVDDCLSILCDVTTADGLRAAAEPPFDLRGLPLAEAIWNRETPDVTIHLGDGETIAAHRWVLEARSPLLKADLALASNNATADHVRLLVNDMDADVCKALLRFIYTDSPATELETAPPKNVEQLLAAADRFQLEKLKLLCVEALCKTIDANSVAAALALAERHGCPTLREACAQFLMKNTPTREQPISTRVF